MEWGELPSVVLLEIYDYLSVKDRLIASTVCKNWRAPVFQVPLSDDELVLKLYTESDIPKVKFLGRNFAVKVQAVRLIFDASSPNCLDLVEEILGLLEDNTQLKSLRIRFSEESFAKNSFGEYANTNDLILRSYFVKKVLEPLKDVLVARNCLETFSFPFIQELGHKGSVILDSLSKTNKAYSIQNLFLATVRNAHVSGLVGPSLVSVWNVNSFKSLQMLSLDHDVLSDNVLATLGVDNRLGGLKRLSLTAVSANPDVSNIGWTKFIANNPICGVRLTVTGRQVMVNHSSNLIFPSIPLTHFRTMHCKGIRISCMNSLIRWNEKSLEHLELIDENYDWMEYMSQTEEVDGEQFLDPLIYAAWRCPNLRTIKIGFVYCGHNLIGIARLKGSNLSCLEIAKSQVVYHNLNQLSQEISKALGRKWKPTDNPASKLKQINSKIPKTIFQTMRALYEDEA
ncbi:unnamed protein product [Orchesella dallaii]|uniref:F-box domain-containing protein n=1 Tax=Orchesella dallaii TaxID=48710 RepID=A0ABP1QKS5_9HEXA